VAADCYLIKGDQVSKTPESGEFLKKGAFVIRGERRYFRDVPWDWRGHSRRGSDRRAGLGGQVKADPCVEIEPGEFNADDLAKRIYRLFSEKVEDRSS